MKMADDALFNLRWDAQRTALLGSVATLFRDESFVDVTLVSNGQMFKAHKLLLSASSPYLKNILESVPSQHAVLFLPHISAADLGNVLKFVYEGEIKISRRSLKSFLDTAKQLKIKGMDFDVDQELTELNSTVKPMASNGAVNSPRQGGSASASPMSKASAASGSEEEPPEKLKILSALLLEPKTEGTKKKSVNNNHNLTDGPKNEVHSGDEEEMQMHPDMDLVLDDGTENNGMNEYGEIDEEEDNMHGYEDDEDYPIMPDVSLQESDESYSLNNNNGQRGKMRPGLVPRNLPIPQMGKLSQFLPKQGLSAGSFNDGILMRMMREPTLLPAPKSGGSSSREGSTAGISPGSSGYYEGHQDAAATLRKNKRYVQCHSCSKVLSSISALKRHMEDVHCARIQGKCLICGRVYSSRNSLLTHVYSAHKKHHDYKAVARIIRESDFEKFAAA